MRKSWRVAGGLFFIYVAVSCSIAQSVPSVSYSLHTKDFDSSDSAQLFITANIPVNFSKIHIDFEPQAKFKVQPSAMDVDKGSTGTRIVTAVVKRDRTALSGDYVLIAHATASGSDATSSFDQQINFTFTRRLSIGCYLLLGLAGFLAGYVVRILTTVLKVIPVPSPGPPKGGDATGDGPVTRFAKAHYYLVDISVSTLLGLAALLYLVRDGHPPDSASAWYGALLTGFGLGFLTNNDLMARIKP
jgi:uncharacterized membrane protein